MHKKKKSMLPFTKQIIPIFHDFIYYYNFDIKQLNKNQIWHKEFYQWVHILMSWSGTASIAENWNNLEKEERDGDSDYTRIGRIRFRKILDSG